MTLFAVAAVAAFNLVCSGTRVKDMPGAPPGAPETYEVVYRIDLGAMRFCTDACKLTPPIASVRGAEIALADRTYAKPQSRIYRAFNRKSGKMTTQATVAGINMSSEMTCTQAPFTGFPAKTL